jgi:hypothetical protein
VLDDDLEQVWERVRREDRETNVPVQCQCESESGALTYKFDRVGVYVCKTVNWGRVFTLLGLRWVEKAKS